MISNPLHPNRYAQTALPQTSNILPALPSAAFIALIFFVGIVFYYFSIIPNFEPSKSLEMFGNDHFWIILQYQHSSDRHHNHHILYHILAKQIRVGLWLAWSVKHPMYAFKLVSALFGALGLVFFYICLLRLWIDKGLAQLFTVLFGLLASYYYFSSTIDTYIPAVAASIVVMLFLIQCLSEDGKQHYIYLGFALGIAVLFRLDNVLLVPLALLPIALSRKVISSFFYCSIGLITGALAYLILAIQIYELSYIEFFDWVFERRIDADSKGLASVSNFNLSDFITVLKNHILYSLIFESGYRDNSGRSLFELSIIVKRVLSGCFYAITFIVILVFTHKCVKKEVQVTPLFRNVILILVVWIVSRILFYLWFNPVEPFLFTTKTVVPVWMLISLITANVIQSYSANRVNYRYLIGFWLACLVLSNVIFVATEVYQF